MSLLNALNWQPTCCAWHGDYAESPARDGGTLRLKRAPDAPVIQCMRFSAAGKAVDVAADGVPQYVEMSEQDVLALL